MAGRARGWHSGQSDLEADSAGSIGWQSRGTKGKYLRLKELRWRNANDEKPAGPGAVLAPCLAAVAAVAPVGSGVGVLDLGVLTDDSSCGVEAPFDVDLFRIRRVRVELTLRVTDPAWRRPATGPPLMPLRNAAIRDVVTSLDVVPRSLADW